MGGWWWGAMVVMALARVAAESETEPVAFRLSPSGAIVVPVSVAGHATRPFLFDTGASRSAVSDEVANRLGLERGSDAVVTTATGPQASALVRLGPATVATLHLRDLTALVLPGAQLSVRAPVDGLIGQDVLRARAFMLDYRRRTVTWLDPDAPSRPGAMRLPLRFVAGMAVIEAEQAAGVPLLRLVPDSGAAEFVLFVGPGRPRLALTPRESARVRTVAGVRVVRRALLDAFAIGDLRLADTPVLLVDGPGAASAPYADGLLPLHLFSRVTFNGPAGYLAVEP